MGAPRHLLVTNDFPPKVGGIQSMLWELWRRLPPESVTVLTTPHEGDAGFDAAQPFRVERWRSRVLLPTRDLVRRIDALAAGVNADLVVLDPALPLGLVGRRLERPYAVVLHGAEVTVPGRLPGSRGALGSVVRGAELVIAAGHYPLAEGARAAGGMHRLARTVVVPPGVDTERFRPLGPDERSAARERFGLPLGATVVLGLSRLVPRKGFDVLIEAAARLGHEHPDLLVAIAGGGRDEGRLVRRVAATGAPVVMLGRVAEDDKAALYGCADVFAMVCRNRWGGLEQEGFGIVFLEAAACGVPQVAGDSGGAAEAVADGDTGVVVADPHDPRAVSEALEPLVSEVARRQAMGAAARERAVSSFTYDSLAATLGEALSAAVSARR